MSPSYCQYFASHIWFSAISVSTPSHARMSYPGVHVLELEAGGKEDSRREFGFSVRPVVTEEGFVAITLTPEGTPLFLFALILS